MTSGDVSVQGLNTEERAVANNADVAAGLFDGDLKVPDPDLVRVSLLSLNGVAIDGWVFDGSGLHDT